MDRMYPCHWCPSKINNTNTQNYTTQNSIIKQKFLQAKTQKFRKNRLDRSLELSEKIYTKKYSKLEALQSLEINKFTLVSCYICRRLKYSPLKDTIASIYRILNEQISQPGYDEQSY